MIGTKIDREGYVKIIIMYLKYRNSYLFGIQPYKFWKNMIRYITGIDNPRHIRSLFNTLIVREYLHVEKIKKNSIRYIFNPTKKDMDYHIKKMFIVRWD